MTTTIDDALLTADDAFKKSGYIAIDYTINEDAFVYDAVQKFAAFNIGCLVTVNSCTCLFFLCFHCKSGCV